MLSDTKRSDLIGYCNRRALLICQSSRGRFEHYILSISNFSARNIFFKCSCDINRIFGEFTAIRYVAQRQFFHHLIGRSEAGYRLVLFGSFGPSIPSQCIPVLPALPILLTKCTGTYKKTPSSVQRALRNVHIG